MSRDPICVLFFPSSHPSFHPASPFSLLPHFLSSSPLILLFSHILLSPLFSPCLISLSPAPLFPPLLTLLPTYLPNMFFFFPLFSTLLCFSLCLSLKLFLAVRTGMPFKKNLVKKTAHWNTPPSLELLEDDELLTWAISTRTYMTLTRKVLFISSHG